MSDDIVRLDAKTIIDVRNQTLYHNKKPIHLSDIEYRILEVLLQNVNKPVSKRRLICDIWGSDTEGKAEELANYIYRLRAHVDNKEAIVTIRNVGYMLFVG